MVDMFTPGKIGSLEFSNRLVRSATWEGRGDPDGNVTRELIDMMVELARGEVGHIVLGITAVTRDGKGTPKMTALYEEEHLASHARLVEAVRKAGSRISIQIAHSGSQGHPKALGMEAVGASAVTHPLYNVTPRALTTEEVKLLIEAFGRSSALAVKAGYDAIQIHSAHGYLLAQFNSPRFNRREDEYGEPGRFVIDVYKAVRANAGDRPVHIKLNVEDFLEGSTTPEISLPIAKALSEEGIDAIEVSSGTLASGKYHLSRIGIKKPEDEGYFLEQAKQVKKVVECPVIGVGGFRSPDVINKALGAGAVEFVAMSRPLINEPGIIKRWKNGDLAPSRCISCNNCYRPRLKLGEGVMCRPKH